MVLTLRGEQQKLQFLIKEVQQNTYSEKKHNYYNLKKNKWNKTKSNC